MFASSPFPKLVIQFPLLVDMNCFDYTKRGCVLASSASVYERDCLDKRGMFSLPERPGRQLFKGLIVLSNAPHPSPSLLCRPDVDNGPVPIETCVRFDFK